MFDLFVIGGGPGGYHAASCAGEAGLTVALAEQAAVGGVCLNEGCIPSKTLLKAAKVYENAKTAASYGVNAQVDAIDLAKLNKRKNKIIKILKAGVSQQLQTAGVTVFAAHAKIIARTTNVFLVQVGDETIESKNVIIATGSEPLVPPIPGLAEQIQSGKVVTNRAILDVTAAPPRLVIVGGGVIGLEMADFFQHAGSQVTVVEMLDEVGGATLDCDAAAMLRQSLAKVGVEFRLNTKVTAFQPEGVTVASANGAVADIAADLTLLSIGRKANVLGLGLEELGVDISRSGVTVDETGCTNVPGLYAIGDVTEQVMLAHAAYHAAEVAVAAIFSQDAHRSLDLSNVPAVIYTHPEVASVGLTAAAATAQGKRIHVVSIPFNYSGRYLAETERESSLCKMVVEAETGCCLGVTLVGPYASEIIMTAALFVAEKYSVAKIARLIFPHPSVVELLKIAAEHAVCELK